MAAEIAVSVHLLGGSSVELHLLPEESILDARAQAADLLGRRPRLVFGGRVLADSETVEAVGLREGSELTAVLSDGPTAVLTASRDGHLRLFDVESGSPMGSFAEFEHGICHASLSPDGTGLLVCGADGTARLLDVGTAECLMTFEGYAGGDIIYSGSCSPDSSKVVVPCTAFGRGRMHCGVAKVFDAKSGFHVRTLSAGGSGARDPGLVYAAAFSPDGAQVLLAADNFAQIFDVETGAVERTFLGHAGDVRSAVFSQDGRRVLTASDDGTGMLFDALVERQLVTLQVKGPAVSAAFASDGRKALLAGRAGADLFDAASGKCRAAFHRQRHGALAACFSPGGSKVLTACEDGSARLWGVEDGKCELELNEHGGAVTSAFFSLDYAEGTRW
mmetsp:Transcript_3126/g.10057  ORF Transcript_3126/g.10057 Transcript_3126/m.10057 type:complete len:390 (+) Transcript_3126:63-1232(+)